MLKKSLIFLSLISFFATTQFAKANISLIRDAQTEKFLRDLTTPIFEAADLNAENVKVYIVNDSTLNAFVSGGQNVFINTGLIRKYKTPDALIGVVAHEAGHIAAGHLARSSEAMEKSGNAMLLSYLLGIGAAVSGSPEAGQAIIMGGSNTAQRMFLHYNRGQEEAADQLAILYLDNMSYPADGLVELLEFFESQMVGYKGQIDEYMMSHPISKKRIDLIKERTKGKNFSDKKINAKLQGQMNIVLAKLEAFIDGPDEIFRKYRTQNDELANYKKAIAFFKKGNLDEALFLLEEIIEKKKLSENRAELGFLYELKGQFLFESGQVQDSVIAYSKALRFLDNEDSAQAKISLSTAILNISGDDEELVKLAIKRLEEAKRYEYQNPFLFKQLANAYDRIWDVGRSFLALAEFNFWRGENEKALKYAKKAKKKLPENATEELLRADDLITLTKQKLEKES